MIMMTTRSPITQAPAASPLRGRPLAGWLPRETLFSWVSRTQSLWGATDEVSVPSALFGGERRGMHHDFPSGLRHFVDASEGRLGMCDEIALSRTLLAFYAPFWSKAKTADALRSMSAADVAHLKYRLGLLTSRTGAHHPMRACAKCAAADLKQYGWTYWHIEHQYPGALICPRHGEPLFGLAFSRCGAIDRPLSYLPDDARGDRVVAVSCEPIFDRFSCFVQAILAQSPAPASLGASVFAGAMQARLLREGWLTRGRRLKLRALVPSFASLCGQLHHSPELDFLPTGREQTAALVRGVTSGCESIHPLKRLVVMFWCFGDAGEVMQAIKEQRTESPAHAKRSPSPEIEASTPRALLRVLLQDGFSASAVARLVGVSYARVHTAEVAMGFAPKARPKRVQGQIKAALVADLTRGMDRLEAARAHGVSASTVDRLLAWEPGLRERHACTQDRLIQQTMRSLWLRASARREGIKRAREAAPAAFAWLYRHDRTWLSAHRPSIGGRYSGLSRVATVDWAQRDQSISRSVAAASADARRSLRLWEICERVPTLQSKLASLRKLPLTRAAIDEAKRCPPEDLL